MKKERWSEKSRDTATAANEPNESAKPVNLKPIGSRCIIRQEAAKDRTTCGLFLPKTAKQDEELVRGVVVAHGPGEHDKGYDGPQVGEMVVFNKSLSVEIEHNGEELSVCTQDAIYATVCE